ncbi:MAG: hypothetical protein JNL01_07355 [Bdellovibrionales bacterium]|nr:hypothetical protein [Bdellovibrionales bacterium]
MFIAFEVFLLKAQRLVLRYPRLTLGLFALVLGLAVSQLKAVRIILSTEDMAGEGIESVENLKKTRSTFNDGYQSIVFLIPPQGRTDFSRREVCEIWRWLAHEKLKHPELQSSFSTFEALEVKRADPKFLTYGRIFDESKCSDDLALADPGPVPELSRFDQGPWPMFRARNSQGQPIRSLTVNLTFRSNENSRFGTFDPGVLDEYRERVKSELPALVPGLGIHWAGEADYQWYVLQGMNRAKTINLVMALVMLILIATVFRSFRVSFLFIGSMIAAGLIIYGWKASIHSPFDLLSTSLFVFLGVATLEDFVFVAAAHRSGKTLLGALRGLIVPAFFTSLTTFIGFASLGISDVAMVRSFGLWAAAGAALEWFIVFLIIPPFWKVFFKGKRLCPVAIQTLNPRIRKALDWRPSIWVSRLAILALPLAVFSALNFKVQDSPERVFPPGHDYLVDLKTLQSIHDWKGHIYLVFPSETSEDLERKVLTEVEGPRFSKWVSDVESLEKSAAFIARNLTAEDRKLVMDEARHPSVSKRFRAEEFLSQPAWRRSILYVRDYDVNSILQLEKGIRDLCPAEACFLAGSLVAFADFSGKISNTLFESLFVSVGLVTATLALLAYRKRQLKNLAPIVLSSIWGPAVMLSVMAFFKMPINFSTCIFLSILVGLTGDNAIQYLYGDRKGDLQSGVDQKAWASIATAWVMAMSSLVFLGAYFAPPKKLGMLLFFGLLISLFGDLWLLKGLLHKPEKAAG